MKYLSIFLSSNLFFGNIVAIATETKDTEQVIDLGIEGRIATSKSQVLHFAQGRQEIEQQFDLFTDNLWKAYLKGEGLIDQDVYRVLDACVFAAEKHQSQTRKGNDKLPYIIHPIGVANSLLTIGKVRDPDILIAALLHDTVEDTETKFEEIQEKYGLRVTSFVREVTDNKSLPKQERKRLQIVNASHKSAGAAQIKLADKLYNLTDLTQEAPEDWDQARIDEYFLWAKKVVDSLPWVNAPLKKAVDDVIASHVK